MTKQRELILQILNQADRHLTADEIFFLAKLLLRWVSAPVAYPLAFFTLLNPLAVEYFLFIEKGYFMFGGSTVILLLEKGHFEADEDILRNSLAGYETEVKYGECIGHKPLSD